MVVCTCREACQNQLLSWSSFKMIWCRQGSAPASGIEVSHDLQFLAAVQRHLHLLQCLP